MFLKIGFVFVDLFAFSKLWFHNFSLSTKE